MAGLDAKDRKGYGKMIERILRVLKRYKNRQINLSSEAAREELAAEIVKEVKR